MAVSAQWTARSSAARARPAERRRPTSTRPVSRRCGHESPACLCRAATCLARSALHWAIAKTRSSCSSGGPGARRTAPMIAHWRLVSTTSASMSRRSMSSYATQVTRACQGAGLNGYAPAATASETNCGPAALGGGAAGLPAVVAGAFAGPDGVRGAAPGVVAGAGATGGGAPTHGADRPPSSSASQSASNTLRAVQEARPGPSTAESESSALSSVSGAGGHASVGLRPTTSCHTGRVRTRSRRSM